MNHVFITMLLLCTFSYAWGADQSPQLSDKYNLVLKIDVIGEPVPSDISIIWSKENTFAEKEQVALKSSDNSLHFGLVNEKNYTWVIWTEIYSTNNETTKRGRAFMPNDIAKLPEGCLATENDIGDVLDKTLAIFIKWNPVGEYKKGEIVAVRRSDGTLRYGCIERMDVQWLVLCMGSSGKIVSQRLKPENIGKFVDFD